MTKDAIIGEYSKIVATIANFMGRKIFFMKNSYSDIVIELLPVGTTSMYDVTDSYIASSKVEDLENLARQFIDTWLIWKPESMHLVEFYNNKTYRYLCSTSLSELKLKLTLLTGD